MLSLDHLAVTVVETVHVDGHEASVIRLVPAGEVRSLQLVHGGILVDAVREVSIGAASGDAGVVVGDIVGADLLNTSEAAIEDVVAVLNSHRTDASFTAAVVLSRWGSVVLVDLLALVRVTAGVAGSALLSAAAVVAADAAANENADGEENAEATAIHVHIFFCFSAFMGITPQSLPFFTIPICPHGSNQCHSL